MQRFYVVERLYLHRSTTEALRPAADVVVELHSSTALYSALQRSTALHTTALQPSLQQSAPPQDATQQQQQQQAAAAAAAAAVQPTGTAALSHPAAGGASAAALAASPDAAAAAAPDPLGEAVQNDESILSRLPSSDEPCWLVAGGPLRDVSGPVEKEIAKSRHAADPQNGCAGGAR